MRFPGFDLSRISRALAQLESVPGDLVDAFFERTEELQLQHFEGGGDSQAGPLHWRREQGFSIRLARGDRTWCSSVDGLSSDLFGSAYRQVARSMPAASAPLRELKFPAWDDLVDAQDLQQLPDRLRRSLHQRRVGLPFELTARRHRRSIQVVGTQFAPPAEHETFFSVVIELPSGRFGALLDRPDSIDAVAGPLVELFRSRDAAAPREFRGTVVLGSAAAAVFLHEAVAHTLEADVLAMTGDPTRAIGVDLGSELLELLDDPAGAPPSVARASDDEGVPVVRRWLLRRGKVEQLIADRRWADRIEGSAPGAGRRADRHSLPSPRCFHLELAPGETAGKDLIAEAAGGLYLEQAARGQLDPLTGQFWIEAPWARRITRSGLGERLGRCRLRGRVGELLSAVTAVGSEARSGGAGWCAKADQRVAVWATSPGVRLEDVEVVPA